MIPEQRHLDALTRCAPFLVYDVAGAIVFEHTNEVDDAQRASKKREQHHRATWYVEAVIIIARAAALKYTLAFARGSIHHGHEELLTWCIGRLVTLRDDGGDASPIGAERRILEDDIGAICQVADAFVEAVKA